MLSTNVLCIKKRKKRSYCISGGGSSVLRSLDYGSGSTEKNKRSSANMFHVTENTPPDMLAGAMDLTVHLTPSKRTVKMSVERSTPMMDLLVQIATNHHLQLSDYTLEALAMLPSSDATPSILPFKPNTPIGALDTQHVRVIPKKLGQAPKNATAQPFESTFRLKVHLPRNQLYVTRVSQSVLLENIMKKVCDEKRLDVNKFELRHPANLDQVLDPKLTLSDYKITEIHIVAKGTSNLSQLFSTSDIIALKKEEERKQFHTKTGGGVFNLIFKRGTAKPSSGSVSSENRSISPTHSDDSRSVTPPSVQQEIITPPPAAPVMERPKPPQRKRRPAPKPPQQKTELTICHSRNSSDSSGYHEASILSDNCNTSLPRRPKSTILLNGEHSQSTSNLSKMSGQSKSTSSLMANNYRKKKSAPPPPPPVLSSKSESPQEQPSPVVASQPPPPTPIQESTVSTRLEQAPPTPVESEEKPPEIIPQVPSPTPTAAEPDFDWQYQLPDAPQGFRDPSPVPPPTDAVDSVVTSPELFEKATNKDSDLTSVVSEEEKPVMNATLSLENLEKRKSLVYNRELATSLKMPQEKKQYPKLEKTEPPSPAPSKSTLPNFQITTYDKPKTKFNIFEDDTIRSNNNNTNLINRNTLIDSKSSSNLEKSGYVGKSMENISYRKGSFEQSYHYYRPPLPTKTFVSRSGSFSTDQSWAPSKPVARSKSQVTLNKYKDNKSVTMLNQENLEKSNSLYDVSGLHSLDVMRRIQNTLNTPTTSTEELDKVVSYQEQPEVKREVQSFERSYVTPAINMGTWSDRPKVPVNVKEDPDYKFGRNNNTKLIVNTTSNSAKSHNSFEVRNVTIKVNGCEPISAQNTGNVVIKIGEASNGIVARKPLGNLHPNKTMPRPHSIAFNEDISRVPIVRSVELKKPYKDLQSNTSITQIYPNSFNSMTLNRSSYLSKNVESPSSFSMMYKSSEALPTASVVRGNSFAQNPTIRGFQRQTWANEYMQNNRDFSTNRSVPFSQSNLRRTESSNKGHHEVRAAQPPPPPPPAMAKLNKVPASAPKISNNNSSGDSRGMLLQAIRDFGGKKGLRAAKA